MNTNRIFFIGVLLACSLWEPLPAQHGNVHVDQTLQTGNEWNGVPGGLSSGNSGGTGASAGPDAPYCDYFNRPDGPLRSDWVVQTGSQSITSGRVHGENYYHRSYSTNSVAREPYETAVVEFDLYPSLDNYTISHVAVVTGAGQSVGAFDQLYTKIQNQDGSVLYNYIGFYIGNNVPAYNYGYGAFMPITPIRGGHIRMYVTNNGDTMNVDIDEDFNGVVDYTYSSPGSIHSLGLNLQDRIGLGFVSDSVIDNFEINGGCNCLLEVYVTCTSQGGAACAGAENDFTVTCATPGGEVRIAASPRGGLAPTGAPCNRLWDMRSPRELTAVANATGRAVATAFVPAKAAGFDIFVQGLDISTCSFTPLRIVNFN